MGRHREPRDRARRREATGRRLLPAGLDAAGGDSPAWKAWHIEGKVYFTARSGGDSAAGQIRCYVLAEEKLTLLFDFPSGMVLDMPDNVTTSRRGGLVICEDGGIAPQQRLPCLTAEGAVVPFAANAVDLSETFYRGFNRDYRKIE